MKGLKAALYKDFKLFFSGAGLLALLLPFLLLLAFQAGMGDLSRQAYVQPFPIAVRDGDGTVMSRSLIAQMDRVALFSQILRAEEGMTDTQLLEAGAAAVVTVPKDFFYDLYKMEDCPVAVTLNRDMPLESTLFQSIFTSVMDIIGANQSAGQGLYRFCYGDLTPDQERAMYAETSELLLQDALSRQTVFESDVQPADVQGALERRLLACVLAVLALFFSIASVKTLPEELGLGVLPRYRAIGGSMAAFLCSKFCVMALLTLPTLLLAGLMSGGVGMGSLLLITLVLLFGSFGLLLAVTAWTGGAAATQRWGNLLLLISLVLGGTLWPRHLLPGPLPMLGKLTLPYYAALGLEAAHRGTSAWRLLGLLWPVLLMGAGGIALAVPGLRHRHGEADRVQVPVSEPAAPPAPAEKLLGIPLRLAGLSRLKFRAMAGGWRGLTALLAAALLCGAAAMAAQAGGQSSLRLAVCDLDASPMSQELTQRLSQRAGLSLIPCGHTQGQRLTLLGEAEGLLTIGAGYAQALGSGEQLPLRYEEASAAVSAQGAREIVAGQVAAQRSRIRAVDLAMRQVGHPLSEEQIDRLLSEIDQAEQSAPPLYQIQTADGAVLESPFFPTPMSFAALAVLLTLLTAAPWSGSYGGRLVERRMLTLPRGRLLSYGSDCLALSALGLAVAAGVLLPSGWPGLIPLLAAGVYAFCSAALALALVRLTTREGRVDGLAPFLALILCLLGGCFMDLSQLSPAFARLSLLTPPGLAVRAAAGHGLAAIALLAEGAALFAVGAPRRS